MVSGTWGRSTLERNAAAEPPGRRANEFAPNEQNGCDTHAPICSSQKTAVQTLSRCQSPAVPPTPGPVAAAFPRA